MLKPLSSFRPLISLIPNSGIQFMDFAFDVDKTPKLTKSFWEEEHRDQVDAEGNTPVTLRNLREREDDGELYDPVTEALPDPQDQQYNLNKLKGFEVFLNKWVPVPFLRIKSELSPGVYNLDRGPTNWARVRIVELPERDERDGYTHRVIIAFDTELRPTEEGRPYLVPAPRDSEEEARFVLVADDAENGWFLNEPWVDEWLDETFREFKQAQRPNRPLRDDDFPYACEHWARYLTFLQALSDAVQIPMIKLVDTVSRELSHEPIQVDLVLDVGNSRTCGILIESNPDDRIDLNDSYVLELRDLSRPEHVYAHPFESRIEFAQAAFGKDHISRRSGRGRGFYWPSVTRVGPEAGRLASDAQGTEGTTGLSSPKRYLWDTRPLNQVWRFNGTASDGMSSEPPVSGPIMAFVTEDGDVIRQRRGRGNSAMRAKFSRSSLYTFMLTEIVLQALVMINSPAVRYQRRHADVPRQLRRIIMTLPPATPLAEQRIMRDRAESAVKLTWDSLGWTGQDSRLPREPMVLLSWDEASCTQLVYLYTEITQKFQGAATDFFGILGKARSGAGTSPALRIASIDIGGGTTDLMITTYQIEGNRAINPKQEFREGFRIAGDDILEAVVERHIMSALERALGAAGVGDPKALLRRLFAGDRGGMSEQEKHLRMQFVTQVTVPIALSLLHAYESAPPLSEDEVNVRRVDDFFTEATRPPQRIVDYLEQAAFDAGAPGFKLGETEVEVNLDALGHSVRTVMGELIADLCEVIYSYDCDVLLLSGRPSRLPAVQDAILARMPVPPDRIVPMHQYRVGIWYPFRDANARIDDPKTTAAVGGMLCALSEGQIENFLLRTSLLRMRSTARFIGEMEISGQILNDRVLFSDIDLEDGKASVGGEMATVNFYAPMFIGFRQLPVERWPATPLYHLEFANPQSAARMSLPLRVTLERAEAEDDDEVKKEDFRPVEIEDGEGATLRTSDVVLRLQTLKSEAGYWLDTGIVAVH